jgi:hypothetical protein
MRQKTQIALGAALACAWLTHTNAGAAGVDAAVEAKMHLNVLGYDLDLERRSDGKLVIAIVYQEPSEESRRSAERMIGAFTVLAATKKVQGMSFKVIGIPYDGGSFAEALAESGVTVI